MHKSPKNIHFKHLANTELFLLNHFLKNNKEPKIGKGDLAYCLLKSSNQDSRSSSTHTIIGSARLIPQTIENKKVFWLRGVFIHPEYRGKGLGTLLIQRLHQSAKKEIGSFTIYAFPIQHLKGFYTHLGYEVLSMESYHKMPSQLQMRFKSAQQQGKNWLCMCFETNK